MQTLDRSLRGASVAACDETLERICAGAAQKARVASTKALPERVATGGIGPTTWQARNKGSGAGMTEQELRKKLELHKTEHRDLDAAIAALTEAARGSASADMLQIARLKKRKLRLKDQIAILEDTLLPDIIA